MYFPISQFQTQHPVYLKNQLFYSCSCEFQIVFKCLKSYDCYERKIINFRPSSIIFSFVSCSLCIAILSLRFGELRSLFVSIVSMKNQWFAKVKINVTSNVFYFYPDFYLVEREGSWRDIFSSEKSNSRFYQDIISIFKQFTINFFVSNTHTGSGRKVTVFRKAHWPNHVTARFSRLWFSEYEKIDDHHPCAVTIDLVIWNFVRWCRLTFCDQLYNR